MSDAADRRTLILDRIAAAASLAGRNPADVVMIAVSKGRGSSEIEDMIAAGQRDFGESRVQEAQEKWPALLIRHPHIHLHFIGRLQSNKAAEAVALFDSIHSVDRLSLVEALALAAAKTGRNPTVYVQVNIGEEEQKGGCAIADVAALVEAARRAGLNVVGLMGIPPLGQEPSPYFALLAKLAAGQGLAGLSMGMSADYAQAVILGATAVRIGSALFDPQ